MNRATRPGTGGRGLPAYVVLDTSASMTPYQDLLNDTLTEIYDTLMTSPQVQEFVHLAIITFSTEPHLVLGATEVDSLTSLPTVKCGGSTNYKPMFEMLRNRINIDVPSLSSAGINVLRPVVFLLTDGAPTDRPADAWVSALSELTDSEWRRHPHIVTYGFGETSETVLKRTTEPHLIRLRITYRATLWGLRSGRVPTCGNGRPCAGSAARAYWDGASLAYALGAGMSMSR
jgi:uncharacterized protein YegL